MSHLITFFLAWILADLFTGLVHWWQDHYLNNDSKFSYLNRLSRDNDLHHREPTSLNRHSYWGSIDTSAFIAWPLCLALIAINAPNLLVMTIFFSSFANIIHRLAHDPVNQLHPIIRFLQKTGFFLSGHHHNVHHYLDGQVISKEDTQVRYCVMTNWLNSMIDRLQIFILLEDGLEWFGIETTKVRNQYSPK